MYHTRGFVRLSPLNSSVMETTQKAPYLYSVDNFRAATFEEQVVVFEYLRDFGQPSKLAFAFEQLIKAVTEHTPLALYGFPEEFKTFYWSYIDLKNKENK